MTFSRTRRRRKIGSGHKNFSSIFNTKVTSCIGKNRYSSAVNNYFFHYISIMPICTLTIIVSRPSRGTAQEQQEQAAAVSTGELRFAYNLLEKLVAYMDRATINMKLLKPSSIFSRRCSFITTGRDIKFFSKVCSSFLENKIEYGNFHISLNLY